MACAMQYSDNLYNKRMPRNKRMKSSAMPKTTHAIAL